MEEQEKIPVCAYCRVSTNSKDQKNSYDNQKEFFENELVKKYDLVDTYADRGITGTSLYKRPEFNRMLYDAGLDIKEVTNEINDEGKKYIKYVTMQSKRKPKFKYIFVKNTSRFARNVLVEDIIRELISKGVHVIFMDLNISTENIKERSYVQIFAMFDELESRDKSIKTKFGMDAGKEKGKVQTNGSTYGYDYSKKTKKYIINKTEAENVKLMFELYSSGMGTRRILKILNEKGIKTKNGKEFNISSIRTLLKNQLYIGILIRNRWDNGEVFNKHKPIEKPEEEWIKFENAVPRIIEDEIFYKCQQIMKERTIFTNKSEVHGRNHGTTKYASKIVCANCGTTYVSRGKHNVYNCKKRMQKGIEACNNPNVKISLLEENMQKLCNGGFAEYIQNIKYAYYNRLDEIKIKLIKKINKQNFSEADELKKQVEIYKNKIEILLNSLDDNDEEVTIKTFKAKKEEYNNEIKKLNNKIEEITSSNDTIIKEISTIDEIKTRISKLNKNIYTEEEMLNEIEKIIVYEGNNEIYLDYIFKTRIAIDNLANKYFNK